MKINSIPARASTPAKADRAVNTAAPCISILNKDSLAYLFKMKINERRTCELMLLFCIYVKNLTVIYNEECRLGDFNFTDENPYFLGNMEEYGNMAYEYGK